MRNNNPALIGLPQLSRAKGTEMVRTIGADGQAAATPLDVLLTDLGAMTLNPRMRRMVAAFGDSRFGRPWVYQASPYILALTEESPLLWAGRLSGGRYFAPYELSYGISSQTAAQFAARADAAAADATVKLGGPGVVVITDPTNSYNTVDPSADMLKTFNAWTDLGWTVVTWYPLPRGAPNVLSTQGLINQLKYADWLRANARSIGVLIADPSADLTDLTVTDGSYVRASGLSADGLHENFASAFLLGKAVNAIISQLFLPSPTMFSNPSNLYSVDNPYGNLLPNPFMTGSAAGGAGITGNVPTNFTAGVTNGSGVTITASKLDANTQRFVFAGTPTAGDMSFLFYRTATTGPVSGDRVKSFAKVNVQSGATGVQTMGLVTVVRDESAPSGHATNNGGSPVTDLTTNYITSAAWSGVMETPANPVSGALTNAEWRFTVRGKANVPIALTVDISLPIMRRARASEY